MSIHISCSNQHCFEVCWCILLSSSTDRSQCAFYAIDAFGWVYLRDVVKQYSKLGVYIEAVTVQDETPLM